MGGCRAATHSDHPFNAGQYPNCQGHWIRSNLYPARAEEKSS